MSVEVEELPGGIVGGRVIMSMIRCHLIYPLSSEVQRVEDSNVSPVEAFMVGRGQVVWVGHDFVYGANCYTSQKENGGIM